MSGSMLFTPFKRGLAALVAGFIVGLVLPAIEPLPSAQAAIFTIADGDVAGLKAALTATAAPHVINLAPNGTYTLTSVDNSNNFGPNGLPTIDRTITINGNGATITRSTAPGTSDLRFFYLTSAGNLTLNNLTLSNGYVISLGYNAGGAIYNTGGSVTINNCIISNNTASIGGAIFSRSNGNTMANLTIVNSGFFDNVASATGVSAGGGGAIYNEAAGSGYPTILNAVANFTVTNSIFTRNSTINPNGLQEWGGGAIENVVWPDSNKAMSTANANIFNSTFTENAASNGNGLGGAIHNYVVGGYGNANLNISNSTFVNNRAAQGSAVHNQIFRNINPGVPNDYTGAIIKITNSTILNTIIVNTGPQLYYSNIYHNDPPGVGSITLRNSLLASNSGSNCGGTTPFEAGVKNIEYPGIAGSPACGANSLVVASNPLGSNGLANNGGPTQTIALPASSPAIDYADPTVCAEVSTVNNRDQRGRIRPHGAGCDVGAYEYGAVAHNLPNEVWLADDDGKGTTEGTLSYALKNTGENQTIQIQLDNGGDTIYVKGPLPVVPAKVNVSGNCNSGPTVIIDGSEATGDGLTLTGNNYLFGIKVRKFPGKQIVVPASATSRGNTSLCVIASKN